MLTLTGVFRRLFQNDHIKTRADVFQLDIKLKVMKLKLSIQRNNKIFCFQGFSKDRDIFRTRSSIQDGAYC